jgi:hypothetical protein
MSESMVAIVALALVSLVALGYRFHLRVKPTSLRLEARDSDPLAGSTKNGESGPKPRRKRQRKKR